MDSGMNMRKGALTHHIPYSSFRDWCYRLPKSKACGAKGILSANEYIVKFLARMREMGHGLSLLALKMKVYDMTKVYWIPFKNGIQGGKWMRWWKRCHLELIIKALQA